MFAEAIEDILRDHCSAGVVRAIEAGGSPLPLWRALENAGFLELLAPESSGGADLDLAELFPIFSHFGRYTVPLPVAETIVARALIGKQVAMPAGMITLASSLRRGLGDSLSCAFTPHGLLADYVLASEGNALVLLPCAAARRENTGIRHCLTATLTWPNASALVRLPLNGEMLAAFAAALYAALLSGAMNRVFEMTLQYCNDRSQFGKSLGKFQAVQHQLSVMAEHTVAASISAEAAFQSSGKMPSPLLAAIAKSRTSEATVLIASIAHALHGAIGVTEEYDLQLLTRRLHEWRMAHGSESYWNKVIGQQVLASEMSLSDFVNAS